MYFSVGNIFIGAILLAIGISVVKNAFYLNHNLIFLEWAEKKWGPGGGTDMYRYIGVAICLFSLFVLIGWFDVYGAAFGKSSLENNNSINQQNQSSQSPQILQPNQTKIFE
jgi:hypothetical protein